MSDVDDALDLLAVLAETDRAQGVTQDAERWLARIANVRRAYAEAA